MRLLVRSNSHRILDDSVVELASSPDTIGREHWQWQLRLTGSDGHQPAGPDGAVHTELALPRPDGPARLSLSVDPVRVAGRLERLDVGEPTTLVRDVRELVAVVVGAGEVEVGGRHRLHELDVLVLEGDDLLSLTVETVGGTPAVLAIARVGYVDGTRFAWVP